jgi:hypothetical protein
MSGILSNRLRLNTVFSPHRKVSLSLAYDLIPRIESSSGYSINFGIISGDYRAEDFRSRLYPEYDQPVGSFRLYHNLDRAMLTWNAGFGDLYLGRQAIAWGSARVVNPTDVLVPFQFNDLDVEDRRGVDAIRMRIPMGFMGEFDAGYVFGDDFEFDNNAFFLRSKFYYRKNDISLLLVGFRENLMLGFDLARPIGGAGFWLEGAYVLTDVFGDNRDTGEDYLRVSTGTDYILRDGTYLFFEYHFNQAGGESISDYSQIYSRTAYREGAVYLLSEHYIIPGIMYQITPLMTITAESIVNLNEPSVFLTPRWEYNIAENVYLAAGIYVGLGDGPEYEYDLVGLPRIIPNSEFGIYPDMFYTSFRTYF